MSPDIINACFELFGAPFALLSIIALYRKKVVRGVSWVHISFFALWGLWNLFYYPYLGQWYSFAGGVALTSINSVWLYQLIYYTWKEKRSML